MPRDTVNPPGRELGSWEERVVQGLVLLGAFGVSMSMLWRYPATSPVRTVDADVRLSNEILVLAGATLVAAALVAVRSFGVVAGLRMLGRVLWPSMLVGFAVAITGGFALRMTVDPNDFWFVLAPIYMFALVGLLRWSAKAPHRHP
jgi:hypothetical protein